MNNSGTSLPRLLKKVACSTDRLLVVCDTLDLPCGACRLKQKGGDAGHNGLKSIIANLGSGDFMRLFIGIGRPESGEEVIDWVLGVPDDREKELLDQAARRAADAVALLANHPVEYVMNDLNRKVDGTD